MSTSVSEVLYKEVQFPRGLLNLKGLYSSSLSSIISVFSSHSSYSCILQRWQSTQRKPGFVNKTLLYINFCVKQTMIFLMLKLIIALIAS